MNRLTVFISWLESKRSTHTTNSAKGAKRASFDTAVLLAAYSGNRCVRVPE